MLRLGRVGLPAIGRSTVFDALPTGGAAAAQGPFCTVQPTLGVAPAPDPRFDV